MPKTLTEREAVEIIKSIPDQVLLKEARKRYIMLRKRYGKWGSQKKVRKCRGCGVPYSARDMRTHKCPAGFGRSRR